jgi:hypothetical protein
MTGDFRPALRRDVLEPSQAPQRHGVLRQERGRWRAALERETGARNAPWNAAQLARKRLEILVLVKRALAAFHRLMSG